jgi:protoporphyrinogen oxidase
MVRVVVLGAGPTGLVAARRMADAGHDVAVVEREDRPGGMAASLEVAGQRVDLGSHRLHPAADPEVLADLRALLGDELQVRERHGRIRLAGRWLGFPLRTTDVLGSLPPAVAARAAAEALASPLRRPRADTFSEVVRAGLGPTVAGLFHEPYARKLWGVPPAELDGELARRRIGVRSPLGVARRLVRGARPEGRRFLSPRRGYGQIGEALAGAAESAGAELLLGRAVEHVRHRESEAEITAGDRVLEADLVLSTIPVARLAEMSEPAPPVEVRAAAASQRTRAMVLVYLVCDRARYTEFDAHYLPGPESPAARLSEPKNYRDGPDPGDRTVLCAEIPCWPAGDDEWWTASDDALAAAVVDSLRGMGLPDPRLVACETHRLPSVYPVYERGFRARLDPLLDWASRASPVVTAGRQGLFVPDNLHHAMAMGFAAARALQDDGTWDNRAWTASLAAFSGHVVED